MTHTVLVVEDYAPWRRHILDELEKTTRWRVVGQATDGIEAVRMAQDLAPDLILLDIMLPHRNGLDVARLVLARRPEARILFLTEQRSADIAEAALRSGGRGYLVKADSAKRLLLAMETVMNGGRFVSATVPGDVLDSTRDLVPKSPHRHDVVFCTNEESLIDAYARFIETALTAETPCIFVADVANHAKVRQRLEERGVSVERAVSAGRFLSLDSDAEISSVCTGDTPDEGKFQTVVPALIATVAERSPSGRRKVCVCGECAPRLWRDGDADGAVALERWWDRVARTQAVDVLCGYVLDARHLTDDQYDVFQQICSHHSSVDVS